MSEERIEIDLIYATCKGCQKERQFTVSLRGATELVHWLSTGLTPCGCGAKHADIKCRMVDEVAIN